MMPASIALQNEKKNMGNAALSSTTEADELSQKKQLLEIEKLELEKRILVRPWWQSPTLASTLVASLVTIAVSWGFGLFDLQRKQIDIETKQARYERDQAKDQQAKVEAATAALENRKKLLDADVTALTTERDAARADAIAAKAEQVAATKKEEEARTELARLQQALAYTKQVLARPALTLESAIHENENRAEWMARNQGPGSASIRKVAYFVDGKEIMPINVIGRSLVPVLEAIDLNVSWMKFRRLSADAVIPAGGREELFWISKDEFDLEKVGLFRDSMRKLSISICYCSIENSCAVASMTSNPPASFKCP